MSLGNDPARVPSTPIEHSEAIAAARQARAYIGQDGPAPSVTGILREMGRDGDGAPLEDGPTEITAHEAARRALGLEPEESTATGDK